MTDEQIIFNLECCANSNCFDCSFDCLDEMPKFSLKLIKKQQAEIDRLKTEKDNLIKTYSECQIAFLREFVEKLGKRFSSNGELSWTAYHSVMGSMEELFASMTGKDISGGGNV